MLFLLYTIVMIVATFFVIFSIVKDAAEIFIARYPGLMAPKPLMSRLVTSVLILLLIAACPIVNLLFIYFITTNEEEIIERTINLVYEECTKNDHVEILEKNGGNDE